MDGAKNNVSMGVGGRLLLAFLGIAVFSLIAAISGLYSHSQVGDALKKITDKRVPEALSWLELARRVESIVNAAPALMVVRTDNSRKKVYNEIISQIEQLEPYLQRNKGLDKKEDKEAVGEVLRFIAAMTENLNRLDNLVKKKLTIIAIEEKRTRDLSIANNIAKRMLSPGERILGAQMADWIRNQETGTENQKQRSQNYQNRL